MGDKEITAEAPPPAATDDIGDETQCTDHPYRNSPGGICAFCLQEKLGKLVSSSSSSSSPPFPSLPPQPPSPPFPSSSSVAPVQPKADQNSSSNNASSSSSVSVLSRSKSVAPATAASPRKKSFWSFLRLSSSSSSYSKRGSTSSIAGESGGGRDLKQNEGKSNAKTLEPEAESHVPPPPPPSSISRKVARSRSVGCGSRSFSGDFLERISTGFGDCALRRVESHREPSSEAAVHHRQQLDHDSERRIKERVKCGGIFGGITGDHGGDFDPRRPNAARASTSMVRGSRSRNTGWAWAFASPMRAFKPATASKSHGPRNNAVGRVNGPGAGNWKVGGGNPSLLAAAGGG